MAHAVEIPRLGSLILKHDLDAPLAGLDTIAPQNRPAVEVVFWSFRVMVGLGLLMFALGAWSLLARFTGKLYEWRWMKRFAVLMGPSGFIAVIAGWITTEVGRQPFTIYGLMRTAESASPLAAPAVGASLVAFVIVYFAVFGMGSWYLLKLMSRPPQPHEPEPANAPAHAAGITPASALAAAPGSRAMADTTLLTLVWAAILAFAVFMYVVMDGFDLGIGVLFPMFRCRQGTRHRHEFHRAGVGRQRDLAGAGRRRIAGGVSAGVRRDHVGAVRAADRHVAGAGVPRRGL